jgi:Tfp pilus assembly protein PilO
LFYTKSSSVIDAEEDALGHFSEEIALLERTRDRLPELHAAQEAVEARLRPLSAILPDQPRLEDSASGPGLWSTIESIAARHRVDLAGFSADESVERADYREIPVTLEAAGSPSAILALVQELQQLERVTHVRRIELLGLSGDRCQANVGLAVFHYPPEP